MHASKCRHMSETTNKEADIVDLSKAQFKIVFECVTALRTLADVMSNMLNTVKIDVWNSEKFRGIKVEAMDPKQISLVIGQIATEVKMDCEHTAFCIDTKTFNTCVRNAPAHFCISIESFLGSSSIRMVAYEPLGNACVTTYTLPTLVCDQEAVHFLPIKYKTFIDMDTSELKSVVGLCLKLQGDTLAFKVRQPIRDEGAAKRPRQDRKHMVLTISSTGQCTQEHTFYSYVEDVGDACVAGKCDAVSQVPDEKELQTTYEEVFGARHLSDFLRSIDRNTVTLRLLTGKPLIIEHKLGGEDAYVSIVVAPQIQEED